MASNLVAMAASNLSAIEYSISVSGQVQTSKIYRLIPPRLIFHSISPDSTEMLCSSFSACDVRRATDSIDEAALLSVASSFGVVGGLIS